MPSNLRIECNEFLKANAINALIALLVPTAAFEYQRAYTHVLHKRAYSAWTLHENYIADDALFLMDGGSLPMVFWYVRVHIACTQSSSEYRREKGEWEALMYSVQVLAFVRKVRRSSSSRGEQRGRQGYRWSQRCCSGPGSGCRASDRDAVAEEAEAGRREGSVRAEEAAAVGNRVVVVVVAAAAAGGSSEEVAAAAAQDSRRRRWEGAR